MDRLGVALALCAVLAGCGAALGPVTPGEGDPAQVTAVVDGDTVDVRFEDGTSETVRLIGVDTPEVRGDITAGEFEGVSDTEAGRACLREWGERASAHATRHLAGRSVRVALDPAEGPRGSYGRLLAYVRVEGRSFNYGLVADGYARVYESGFTRQDRYLGAESRARANASGVWTCATGASGTPTPGDGGDGPVTIADVRPDPPGDDTENLNAESVVLEHVGDDPVDLAGWTVADEAGHVYTFGDLALQPGARVTLHTGTGTDTETDVYWGRGGAVWNNDGDVVTVRDAGGAVVARARY